MDENNINKDEGETNDGIGDLDDAIVTELENAFHRHADPNMQTHEVARIVSEYTAVDIAYAVGRLPQIFRPTVYENLPDEDAQAQFLVNTDANSRRAIFRKIDDEHIVRIIEKIPPDEAVGVMADLPQWRFFAIMEKIGQETARRIKELQTYDEETAGRLMSNEFFAFDRATTIGHVISAIRNNPHIDYSRRIFVVDAEGRLEGYVPARNIIINHGKVSLKQVMRPVLHKVSPEASRSEVIDLVERYKISALPIVDDDEKLLGILTYDDVVEIMEDLADETIAQMAGTAEDFAEQDGVIRRFLWRAPWLIVTLCAGLFLAYTLTSVQDALWFAIVAPFVPLIAGMSGNVGIQCSTILVRGMATGELSRLSKRRTVKEELAIGLLTGLVFGSTVVLVLAALHVCGINPSSLPVEAAAITVGLGVVGACLTASCLGVFSPLLFVRIGIDPAVAAGPMITACNDCLSALIFCLIAKTVTGYFHA